MSLRDLGVFAPLEPDHPMAVDGERCHYCHRSIAAGVRVVLVPWHTADEVGSNCVEAQVVCATCGLRGRQIATTIGRRIAQYVHDGDVERPVVTTDGRSWRDEEVGP